MTKFATTACLFALPLLLVACGGGGDSTAPAASDQPEPAAAAPTGAPVDEAPAVAPATPVADAASASRQDQANQWQTIVVTGVTCGDNCYVEYHLAGARDEQTALCDAEPCMPWFEQQSLPDQVRGTSYEVQMGEGDQVDGDGDVMQSGFPKIIAMRSVR